MGRLPRENTALGSPDSPERPAKRVVVVDDHPIVISGVRHLFASTPRFTLVGGASSGAEAIQVCTATAPDLVLLDLRLPDLTAAAVCRQIRAALPHVVIAIWTAQPDVIALRGCLHVGASACLAKDVTENDLLKLLDRVVAGRVVIDPRLIGDLLAFGEEGPVSRREREVLILMSRGLSTPQIAERLDVSVNTVKTHRHALLAKLGARNRIEALQAADAQGLLTTHRH